MAEEPSVQAGVQKYLKLNFQVSVVDIELVRDSTSKPVQHKGSDNCIQLIKWRFAVYRNQPSAWVAADRTALRPLLSACFVNTDPGLYRSCAAVQSVNYRENGGRYWD